MQEQTQIKKNDEIELRITGTAHDGSGVGRYNNMVIFVPTAAEGDFIKAKILSVKTNLAFAKLLEVLKPSPYRIPSDCGVFEKCGGCVFRHISYDKELEIKKERVKDTLVKIGHIDFEPEEIIGMPEGKADGYRNKAQYPIGLSDSELRIGFYAPRSHRIIDFSACKLQPPVFESILHSVRQWIEANHVSIYDEVKGLGLIRHLYIRQAPTSGEIMVCLVATGGALPNQNELVSALRSSDDRVVSIILNINKKSGNAILGEKCVTLWGKECITDTLCGLQFEISPLSFYQVNSTQAEKLYSIAADFAGLAQSDILLDLYCGTGTIGLTMASRVNKLIGVEVIPQAIEDAKRNARLNGIENVEFYCADAGQAAADFEKSGLRPDVVIVDPPRKGCSTEALEAIIRMQPDRIVYISCDPATLARDLAIFSEKGYSIKHLKAVDLFPRTAHVECVALISRAEK